MAVKLLFDKGPRGRRINTTKRVRLLLGFYGEKVPHLFYELRNQSKRRDKYTEIDFVQILKENNDVTVKKF
jgi:thioredoxin reductase